MSKEAVGAFLQKAKDDVELQHRLEAGAGEKKDPIGYIVDEAARMGFHFTAEEFKATQEGAHELSEKELEAVAGGAYMVKWTFRF